MGQWFIGKIALYMEIDVIDKELSFNPPKHYGGLKPTFQHSNIPPFHYSMCEAKTQASKKHLYSQ